MAKARRGGGFCCYCKRGPLLPSGGLGKLAMTKDHVNPRANGGGRWVPCCRQCNGLKGCLPPPEWFWFIDNHPAYWKTFRNHVEVTRAVAAEMARRVRAGEAPISNNLLGSPLAPEPSRGTWNA